MPPTVKITAFFDNKFQKTLAQFKILSVTPDTIRPTDIDCFP